MEELFSQHATVFLTPSPSKKQKKKKRGMSRSTFAVHKREGRWW